MSTRSATVPAPVPIGSPVLDATVAAGPAAVDDATVALAAEAWRIRSIEPTDAITMAERVLPIACDAGDRRLSAHALRTIAVAHVALASYSDAIRVAHDSLEMSVAFGDVAGEAMALATMGAAQRRLGDNDAARGLFARALERARLSAHPDAIIVALNGFGHLYRSSGEYDRSLEMHRDARERARTVGNDEEECAAALGIGGTLERLGRFTEALEVHHEALAIARRIGHVRMEAYASGNVGTILERLGRVSDALEYELRSLAMKQRANDRWGLGVSYNNLGIMYRYLGEYASALEAHMESLRTTRAIGDREGESVSLNCIGQVYEELGDMTRVLECYTASLDISNAIGFRQGQAYSLGHLGRFHEHLGDIPRALMYYLRSLRMSEATGDRYHESAGLVSVGQAYGALGDLASAETYLRRALEIGREMGDPLGQASSLHVLGRLLVRDRHDRCGLELLEQALELADRVGNRDAMRSVLLTLADAHARSGDDEQAQRYRARYQTCTEEIFNVESTRRVSELLIGFEGDAVRRHGLQIGLEEADLAEIDAAVHRGVANRIASARSAFVRTSDDGIDREGRADADPTGLVVRTLGEFRVSVGGRELGTAEWKRKRARDLFKLLLINHRRSMSLDEIIEALWEGKADRKSEMLVMNAISHIRGALEPERRRGSASSYLTGSDRTYSLNLSENAWVDFLRFKETIVSARRVATVRERRDLYEQAADLYRGDFLKEDYYEAWSAPERDLLKDAFLEATEFLAVEYARSLEHDAAIDAARRILAHDATSERAYEVLLASLVARGRHAEARRVLEECRAAFRRELDDEPPAKLAALLNAR
jgi:tetratricopeptide (TPR) repeat protein/DNA-binding SARP family transcriptional activator